jgi:hypothetical protein
MLEIFFKTAGTKLRPSSQQIIHVNQKTMLPTFNYADIRTDANGLTFLDLEIQVLFNDQKILFRYTFSATANFKSDTQTNNNSRPDVQSDS